MPNERIGNCDLIMNRDMSSIRYAWNNRYKYLDTIIFNKTEKNRSG